MRVCVALACVSLLCSSAFADCKGTPDDSRELVLEGRAGWWVDEGLFNCMLKELEVRRATIDAYAEYQMITDTSVREYRAHIALEKRATERAREALEMAQSELAREDTWLKSPVLWFAAGVLVSSVAVVAVGAAR